MADFAVEQTVAVSAGAVWELLGDFGAAVQWGAPAMETCRVEDGVGAVRTLTGNGLAVSEKLESYDPGRRGLSY